MPHSWNGFSTTPHTLPDQCALCAGATGGDFLTLPCGHGSEHQSPLHVACVVKSFKVVDTDDPQPPRCPLCRAAIGQDMLSELVQYVQHNPVVEFPDEHDTSVQKSLCTAVDQEIDFIKILSRAQRLAEGGGAFQPTEDEKQGVYWEDLCRDLKGVVFDTEREIEACNYTLDDLDHQRTAVLEAKDRIVALIGRASLFQGKEDALGINPQDLSYRRVIEDYTSVGQSLERLSHLLLDEKKAFQSWESDRAQHSKKIWTAFDTTPYTRSDACPVCRGNDGGDFIILDCEHGAPGHGPLHVRCVVDEVIVASAEDRAAVCPTCQKDIEGDTLARIADCAHANQSMAYLDKEGAVKGTLLCTDSAHKKSVINSLITAQTRHAGTDTFIPRWEEFKDGYYADLIDTTEDFVTGLHQKIQDHSYTNEELTREFFRLQRFEHRVAVAAGRAAQYEGGSTRWIRDHRSFAELYARLRVTLGHISLAESVLRREKEAMEAVGLPGEKEKIWNGFQTDPETNPNACVACYGQYEGEFITLACGHGAPGDFPLHVHCVLESIRTSVIRNDASARCPVCQVPVSENVLSHLMDYVCRNREVRYPDDVGDAQAGHLFDDDNERLKVLEDLVIAQDAHAGGQYTPSADDPDGTRYERLIEEVERTAENMSQKLEDRAYTLEELEEKQEALEDLEHRAAVAAGQIAYSIHNISNVDDGRANSEAMYNRLLAARERLEDTMRRTRQEKEEIERREEEGAHHLQPA